ncbi:hypothetical protein D1872_331620 [compost metagenome]
MVVDTWLFAYPVSMLISSRPRALSSMRSTATMVAAAWGSPMRVSSLTIPCPLGNMAPPKSFIRHVLYVRYDPNHIGL